ncbi:MAG: murein hydrolase activator EnvC family protein [Desulfomonilia bacterium]|jgi:septal ring factor EnvC (AmiA/AmiB activator)|uniref:Murein hydrolase activator EnvC n=1 Tax=anaerobic digester metagenome TaxID=1263854 RepID=A0A485LYB4_9ZZZZ|nr:peptidoglycan DD-metalloendopeptidase family protein [Pseudomonadota bacterium]HPD21246.1 peptidoglycan DD-metalloendopeptidase family protein [Deltaproteobacteria bacterium]HPX18243.1 peptidoglycan DD-metalloendopeptidase family protein [Deltaproteobacteria bacterium]HRS55760.1 peptidoglycan DD-metalloendopeptidase family protein [Desulfomonilia bacterium]HRV34476.1 peptidoglycan DD-metalloendopeptidase family protein [Desulfomonilia bacterium]
MIRSVVLLFAIVLPALSVLAADDPAAELEALTKKAREVHGTYLSEEKKLKSIDSEIQRMQNRIDKVRANITSKQAQIALLDKELADYEASLAAAEKGMHHQWVQLYKGASLDLAGVYCRHERYSGYINAVISERTRIVREYQGLKEEREATREKARKLADLLRQDLAELEKTMAELAVQRDRKTRLVSSLKGQSKKYQDQIQDLLEKIQKSAGKAAEAGAGFLLNKGKLPWPVEGKVVRKFGPFTLQGIPQRSQGIDIEVQEGIPVKSVHSGKVVYFNWMGGYGNTLILDHGEGYYSIYSHLQEALKAVGDMVMPEEIIGRAGQSGDVLKPTLHFEIRSHGKAQDPHAWLIRK